MASISGTILAVCSCTVLPLFAGIYAHWAPGSGRASAFLYAGPAINVLAIVLTARDPGRELGLARAVGAIVFSVVIGLGCTRSFATTSERAQAAARAAAAAGGRPLWQTGLLFAALIALLVMRDLEQRGATRASGRGLRGEVVA